MSDSYIISKDMGRIIIPQIVKTGILCLLFFVAIKVNLYLFVKYGILSTHPHKIVDLLIAAIIFLLFVIQIVMTYIRTIKCSYTFYEDRIEQKKWSMHYNGVFDLRVTQDRLDKIFKTGTVNLAPGKALEHIKHSTQMVQYVQRLIDMQGNYAPYSSQTTHL